jgi:hypothetical protein
VDKAVVGLEVPEIEIDPALPDEAIELPFGSETWIPVIWIGIGFAAGLAATWKVAVATVPAPITVESMPHTMQVVPEQETDLFAAVAALPTTTLTLVMSDV